MSDWPIVRLGDYCSKIGSGATPRGGASVYLDEGKICLIRSQNIYNDGFKPEGLVYITEESAEKLKNVVIEKNDVLLNITGDSVARVCLAKEEYLPARVNQHVAIVRPDPEEFDARYLRYLLASPAMQNLLLTIAAVGATRNALTKNMIETLDVSKPPLDVQVAIADNLESLDNKIELNRQTNQTLEHIAQAIFKSWFVDFEPTRAKIAAKQTGQDPERAAIAAISGKSLDEFDTFEKTNPEQYQQLKNTAALFPDALVDSELGEIPKGWEVSTLGKHFNVVMGQSPKGDTYNEDGEGMLFFQGRRDFGFRYPSPRVYTTEPKRLAQAGDTLISVRAPVGDRNMANQECCLGRGVAGIRHNTGARSFTYAFIGHIESSLSDSGSDGTVFSSINKNELSSVGFIAPQQTLLSFYEELVGPIDDRVEINSKEIASLEALRETLLPKLLSGEITTPSSEVA